MSETTIVMSGTKVYKNWDALIAELKTTISQQAERIAELEAKLEVQIEWLKEADAVDKDNKAKVAELEAEKKALRTEYLKLWHAFP